MVLREKFWIDDKVQGVLIGRVILYWAIGVLYLAIGMIGYQVYQHPDWSVPHHAKVLLAQTWPWIPSLVLVVPLVLFDIIKLSNLFAGPIYRLRGHLNQLVTDPECVPLKFREDDYWQDLVPPVNRLQYEILELRKKLAQYEPVDTPGQAHTGRAVQGDAVGAADPSADESLVAAR